MASKETHQSSIANRPVVLTLGALYLPMALTAVTLHESSYGVSPTVVVPALIKAAPASLLATVLFLAMVWTGWILQVRIAGSVPYVGGLLNWFVLLYFLITEMHVLGLMFFTQQRRVGWFE